MLDALEEHELSGSDADAWNPTAFDLE